MHLSSVLPRWLRHALPVLSSRRVAAKLPGAVLSLTLVLAGCSHVPLASLPQLASLDLMTADISVLRAAVRAPDAIVPTPGGAVLQLSYWRPGEEAHKTVVEVPLEEEPGAQALAALKAEERPGMRITVFRLGDESRRKLEAARAAAMAMKSDEMAKGRRTQGSLAVSAKGCATGPLPEGPLRISTYLRLKPGGDFVPLLQDVDLRELAAQAGVKDLPIEPCGR